MVRDATEPFVELTVNGRRRETLRWQSRYFAHRSFGAFASTRELRRGVHTIWGFRYPIDLLFLPAASTTLLISFHGAVDSPRLALPYFVGMRVATELGFSLLAISDSGLYSHANLRIGWYAGARKFRLQAILRNVIARVIRRVRPARVTFLGGSGGGFAAMLLSSLFEGATCVVWNPQTDILRYNRELTAEYCSAAFGLATRKESEAMLPRLTTHSLCTQRATRRDSGILVYLQNNSDLHIHNHLNPYLRELNMPAVSYGERRGFGAERQLFILDNWGKGHVRAPTSGVLEMLRAVTAGDLAAVSERSLWVRWCRAVDHGIPGDANRSTE